MIVFNDAHFIEYQDKKLSPTKVDQIVYTKDEAEERKKELDGKGFVNVFILTIDEYHNDLRNTYY
jgi:hypothetical protein